MEKALEEVGLAEAEFAEVAAKFAEFLACDWPVNLAVSNDANEPFERLNLIGPFEFEHCALGLNFLKRSSIFMQAF